MCSLNSSKKYAILQSLCRETQEGPRLKKVPNNIPHDVVAAARKFTAQGYERLPKILAVDVARFGDDRTVLGIRQGRRFTIYAKLRGVNTVETTERIIACWKAEKPDAVIVDGDGLGAGVVDQLQYRGYGRERVFMSSTADQNRTIQTSTSTAERKSGA